MDNITAYSSLCKYILKGPSNTSLQEIWLLVAKWDIFIEPHWIEGKKNGLANTLSRFDKKGLIDLCSHWQNFSSMMTLQHPIYP